MLRFIEQITRQHVGSQLEAQMEMWQRFAAKAGLEAAKPNCIGIKTADRDEFNKVLTILSDRCRQVHIGTVDNRKIAIGVPNSPISGIPLVKLMERRKGSDDPTGLDHIDYLFTGEPSLEAIMAADGTAEWQQNDVHRWLSIRFGSAKQFEAKLVDHVVLRIGAQEMLDAEASILAG